MWEEILKAALESGLWAVLFCVLLLYQLRDGRTRESKYRSTIDALVERLGALSEVQKETHEAVVLLRRASGGKKAAAKPSAAPASENEAVYG